MALWTKDNEIKLDTSNPVIRSIMNGGVKPNPEYNSKTKKDRQQPQYIKDTDPKDFRQGVFSGSVESRSTIGYTPQDLGLTSEEYRNYNEYGVTPSPFRTQEEIDKIRAENQSALEQTGRMIGQAVVNEAVLGTFAGFSNLVDAIGNMFTDENHDFTNPMSSTIESWQDALKERWAIYREDPNATFAMNDFGWWTDNAVSVMSTASMLLPTLAVTKGLSWLGKGIRALGNAEKGGKLIQGLNRAGDLASADRMAIKLSNTFGNKFKGLNDAGAIADKLRYGREITQNALMSRTMESYLEARETYREVHRQTVNDLKNMSKEDKDKFFKYNPELVGKTDEEIADIISADSAHETYKNDFAMLGMDIIQFKGLADIYNGGRKASNAAIALATKKQKDKLLNRVVENTTLKDKIRNSDFLFKTKYMLTHPMQGMFAIEWSEGIEEGYQGIQVEKGKEVAKRYFDPNYSPRQIESYLSDPSIYEQALWGVIGSVAFAGLGKGLKKLSNKIGDSIEERTTDKAELELKKLSDQKQREKGIEGWTTNILNFNSKMALINNGYNPFKTKKVKRTNENGKEELVDATDENGVTQYETIDENEKQLYKDKLLSEFLTEMGINATERGNFDIFKAFITDPKIAKFIHENSQSNAAFDAFNNEMIEKLTKISDLYLRNNYKVRNSVFVKNPYVGRAVAREMTRMQIVRDDYAREVDNIQSQIDELLTDDNTDYSVFEDTQMQILVDRMISELNASEVGLNSALANGKISNPAYQLSIDDLNRLRAIVYQFATNNQSIANFDGFNELISAVSHDLSSEQISKLVSDLSAKYNAFKSQFQLSNTNTPPEAVIKLMTRKNGIKYAIAQIDGQMPHTQSELQREYNEKAMIVDQLTVDRYNTAVDKVNDWISKQSDLVKAKRDLYTNNVPELEEELQILKIGHKSTERFWWAIDGAFEIEAKARAKAEAERNNVTVNGVKQTPENAAQIREELEKEDKEEEETVSPSTGGSTQAATNEPTVVPNQTQPTPTTPINPPQTPQTSPQQAPTPTTSETVIEEEPAAPNRRFINPDEEFIEPESPIQEDFGAVEEESEQLRMSDWERNRITASSIVKDIIKENPNLFKNININDRNTKKYKDLIKLIADKIIEETGVPVNEAEILAEYGIAINQFLIKNKLNNVDIVDLAQAIIAEIRASGRFSALGSIESIFNENEKLAIVDGFLQKYVEERRISNKSKKGPQISFYKLLDYIVNNDNISKEQAIEFFVNIYSFINNNRDKLNYRFIGIREFKKVYRNPQMLIATLEAAKNKIKYEARHQHINASNNPNAERILNDYTPGSPVQVVYDPYASDAAGRNIRFYINGEEVGFLAPVAWNETNTVYSSLQNNGIRYQVTKNSDGTYTIKYLDKLMNALLLDTDNNERLYKALLGEELTEEEAAYVLNHPLIKEMLNDEYIGFPKTVITNIQTVQFIKNKIIDIIYYNKFDETNEERYLTYTIFKQKVFDNYQMTHKLMTTPNPTATFRNIWQGNIMYSEKEYDCNTRGFNAKDNPIIGVVSPTEIIMEGNDHAYPNPLGLYPGRMGFAIRDSDNGIAVALITSSNPISGNRKYKDLLHKELKRIFTDYINHEEYDFDKLKRDLSELFGGPNINTMSIFDGISVVGNSENIALATRGNEKNQGVFLFKINKYKKGTKEERRFINHAKKYSLDEAIDNLINRVKFNTSYITIKNVNKVNVINSKYMFINHNGKLVITLGNRRLRYDSFTDFALKENAFKTNQEVGPNGEYFDNEFNVKTLYVDTESITFQSPVEGQPASPQSTSKYNTIEDVANENIRTDIPTIDLLRIANVPQDVIDLLTGNNEANISLVSDNIRFDKKLNKSVFGEYRNGNIYVGRKLIDNSSNTSEIVRSLIHENIHRHFANLSKEERERILKNLEDTYIAAIKALRYDITHAEGNRLEQANKIYNWIIDNQFTPEEYGNKLPNKNRQAYYTKTKEERRQHFLEEWLVESLTQKTIIDYLNNTDYTNASVNTANKSIWQKIIETLLKLFNLPINRIKNNTILAAQLQILDGNYVSPKTNETTEETIIENEDNKDDEEILDDNIDDNNEEETEDNENTEDYGYGLSEDFEEDEDDDRDSILPSIDNNIVSNNTNYGNINNMDDFLNNFKEEDRPNIEKALNDGSINWACM